MEFDQAANGIVGLETALPLTMKLVDAGALSLAEAVRKLTTNPARIFGLSCGTLSTGVPADVTIFDPARPWRVEATKLQSKGKNSPFDKWELNGKVMMTLVGGRVVYNAKAGR